MASQMEGRGMWDCDWLVSSLFVDVNQCSIDGAMVDRITGKTIHRSVD